MTTAESSDVVAILRAMTAQALAGMLAGLLLAALVIIVLLERRRRGAELEAWSARREADRRRDELAVERDLRTQAELELARRDAELARRPLEGELVLVNTPKPDDQTLKGVCRRELRNGGLVLEAAVYVERELQRGETRALEVPVGDVVVPAYSFAQIVQRTQED